MILDIIFFVSASGVVASCDVGSFPSTRATGVRVRMLRLGDDCYQRGKSCADRAVLSCGSVQRPTSTFSSLLCSLLNNCLSSSRSAIPARYFKRKLAPSLFEWTLQPKATTVAYHFVKIQIVFFFWMYKSSSQYDERLRQCLSITGHCFLKEKNDVMRLPEII